MLVLARLARRFLAWQFLACGCLGLGGAGGALQHLLQASGLQLAATGSAAWPGRTL